MKSAFFCAAAADRVLQSEEMQNEAIEVGKWSLSQMRLTEMLMAW